VDWNHYWSGWLYSSNFRWTERRDAANSVFIKLWLNVKHSTLNHYFAFMVG
jgi:hypothetical protein